MYHESSNIRIDERIQNAKLVQELVEDRNKFKKNYNSLMDDVDKFMKDTEKRVMEENLKKINEEKNQIFDLARPELEAEVMKLNSTLFVMKEEKQQWEKEREELKEEKQQWGKEKEELKEEKQELEKEKVKLKEDKRKLEYTLYDLLKVSHENKDKLLKIKEIVGDL